MSARTAFVTGASGFLGYHLVARLLAEDWQVMALARDPEASAAGRLAGRPVEWRRGDVTDAGSLRRAIPEGVDAVFHLAADLSRWSRHDARQLSVNVQGTRNVVAAALERRARRLVHASSIAAFGLQRGRLTEDSPRLGGRSPVAYQRSKLLSEEIARAANGQGLATVILNPAFVIGSGDRHGWAGQIEELCHARFVIVPPGGGSFAGAPEVAEAFLRAAERGRPGESYLLGGVDLSFAELNRLMAHAAGVTRRLRPLPAWALKAAVRGFEFRAALKGDRPRMTMEEAASLCLTTTCDWSKAARELDYRAPPLEQRIAESHAWLRDQGVI